MELPAVTRLTDAGEPAASSLAAGASERLRTLALTFAPGAAHGVTTVLLGHPLDTAKTRMQAGGPQAQRSAVGTMAHMAQREGVRSLFRGCSAPLLMEGVKRSMQFAMWDVFRESHRTAQDAGPEDVAAEEARAPLRAARQRWLAVIGANHFLSGAVAGGMGTLIGCPMHVVKIQTQYQTREGTRNAWTCAVAIFKREGPLGFYRGFKYNLLKDVCFAGTYLGMYGWLRDHSEAGRTAQAPLDTSAWHTARAFLCGATASVVTWTLLYPLDTLKTLVQAGQQQQLSRQLLTHPSSLYRGLVASLLKAGPVSGAAMCVYELTRRRLDATPCLADRRVCAAGGAPAGGSAEEVPNR